MGHPIEHSSPRASSRTEIHDGIRDIWPAAVAAIPIGLLLGAICTSKGLSPMEVALMSGLVCAGAAQFAALEIWAHPVPAAAILLSTLLVNSRNVLMSASLAPKTGLFARWQRASGFYVLSDENWALSEQRSERRALRPEYFITMGVVLYVNWVSWTTIGSLTGTWLGNPRDIGADFAFTALFIAIVAGFWKGPRTATTIAASAAASAAAYLTVGSPWHVPAGALAGVAAAYLSWSEAGR